MPISAVALSVALLTACASSKSASTSNATTSTGGSGAASSSGSSSSTSSSSGSGSSPLDNAYMPVKLGNTWVYRTDYGSASLGQVTETEKITKVQPLADGQQVTVTRTFHYANGRTGDVTSTAVYVFHKDGSLTVPYQSGLVSGGPTVVVKSGSIIWPSPKDLSLGTPRTGVVQLAIQSGGRTVDTALHFTVQGVGRAVVTVPAGTYRAHVLDQTMTEQVSSVSTPLGIHSEIWTAEGVGLVKSASNASALTGGSTVSTVLVKFTQG